MIQIQLSIQEIELLIQCIEQTVSLSPQDEFDNIRINQFETVNESDLDELREKLTEAIEE